MDRLAKPAAKGGTAVHDLALALLHLGDFDRERKAPSAVATLTRAVAILRDLDALVHHRKARTDLLGGLIALADVQPIELARATVRDALDLGKPLRDALKRDPADAALRQAVADLDDAKAKHLGR